MSKKFRTLPTPINLNPINNERNLTQQQQQQTLIPNNHQPHYDQLNKRSPFEVSTPTTTSSSDSTALHHRIYHDHHLSPHQPNCNDHDHHSTSLLIDPSSSSSSSSSHPSYFPSDHHHHHNHFNRKSELNRTRNPNRIHPIALLPAFVLGILISFYSLQKSGYPTTSILLPTQPFFRSTIDSSTNPNHQDWLSSISKSFFQIDPSTTSHRYHQLHHHHKNVNYRDHVYFPYDYLNQTFSRKPISSNSQRSTLQQYPIFELIHNASQSWNSKLERQSKSLSEAVQEYRRRYNRPPPQGFKQWYEWCVENEVVLIDEYDRVNQLIEPFWALPPHVLRNRTTTEGQNEAFSTFVIKAGQVKAIGPKKDAPRTIDQLKLLEVIVPHLPDVNVTMSHHDGPSVFMDWKTKQRHLEHARAGKVLPPELIDHTEDDASLWGFVGACPPDSPMRMQANGLARDLAVKNAGPGGYIGLDHIKTMNLCDHPEWQEYHGFTSWAGPRPLPLRPIFSFAQSHGFVSDILNAPLEQFDDSNKNADQVKAWSEKKESKRLLWRGQTTGVWFDRTTNWRKSHRVRLHRLGVAAKHDYGHQLKRALRTPGLIKTNRKENNQSRAARDEENSMVVIEKEYSLAQLSERFLSASFVGSLVQCTVEDSSCEAVSKELEFSDPVDWQFQNDFKYVLDVDGNSWSGRFRRLLKSNSLVFKSTIWPEWYQDQIQAWVHYIPVRIDYEDLFDLMSFFTGGLAQEEDQFLDTNGFEEVAEQIARQGSQWADRHFRYQDIRAYVWRTYLEWARVTSDARETMNFELQHPPNPS